MKVAIKLIGRKYEFNPHEMTATTKTITRQKTFRTDGAKDFSDKDLQSFQDFVKNNKMFEFSLLINGMEKPLEFLDGFSTIEK